jgi:hypothetical protein
MHGQARGTRIAMIYGIIATRMMETMGKLSRELEHELDFGFERKSRHPLLDTTTGSKSNP